MRKATTFILAAAAAIPLSFAAAVPASAAPDDVVASFFAQGNIVFGEFNFPNGVAPESCMFVDVGSQDASGNATISTSISILSDSMLTGTSVGPVPDGVYTIDWLCETPGTGEIWGSRLFGGLVDPTTVAVPGPIFNPNEPSAPDAPTPPAAPGSNPPRPPDPQGPLAPEDPPVAPEDPPAAEVPADPPAVGGGCTGSVCVPTGSFGG